MGEWMGARTANLVRRNGRLYYAQLKIAGKVYRRSLQTEKLDIARIKLPDKLKQIREDVGEMVTAKHGLATLRAYTRTKSIQIELDRYASVF
jgi:hypothetical protein